jgi:hypothetical protein
VLGVVLAALALQAAQTTEGKEVIVTGQRLPQTQAALDECLARHCPLNEEIAAALAHAENLFVAGDYKTSQKVLLRTTSHIHGQQKTYPVAVADLWRATSRVSAHLGDADDMRIGMFESLSALKAGLPADDPQILAQRVEVADVFAQQSRVSEALTMYQGIASDAKKRNLPVIRGYALLRIATIDELLAVNNPAVFGQDARDAIQAIENTTEPELAVFRAGAEVMKARIAAKGKDTPELQRLAAQYKSLFSAHPMLIYAPPMEDPMTGDGVADGSTVQHPKLGDFEGQWVDVAFRIAPDGSVYDVGIVKESQKLDVDWTKPVLKSIAGRRYAPLSQGPDAQDPRRVERYTQTAYEGATLGSHIQARTGPTRLEMLDLTVEPAGGSQ